jgi:hypothetical protein
MNVLKPVETMVNYIQARYSLGARLTSPLLLDSEFGNSPMSRDHFYHCIPVNLWELLGGRSPPYQLF